MGVSSIEITLMENYFVCFWFYGVSLSTYFAILLLCCHVPHNNKSLIFNQNY